MFLSAFPQDLYNLHNLIFIHMAGLIFRATSSLYVTINLHMMLQFNQIVERAGDLILSRCHQEVHIAIVLEPFPTCCSLEIQEVCTAS
jgi:hypothetical protein